MDEIQTLTAAAVAIGGSFLIIPLVALLFAIGSKRS